MKIIKHGNPVGNQKHKAKCYGCGAVIEFLTSEAQLIYDPRDGNYYRIKCPCCPRDITKAAAHVWY